MTTTIETPKIKLAGFGSISHGTLRTEDLLEKFAAELEWQIQRNGEYFSRPENFAERDKLNALVAVAQDQWTDDGTELLDEEVASELVNEQLMDALQEFCLPYFYFGTHCGDGSDFGFWLDDISDVKEQVGFVSSVEQEHPDDDFQGEWLHVNERGNSTLYVRNDAGKDVEIWALA